METTVHSVPSADPACRDNDELDIAAFLAAEAARPERTEPPTTVTANAMHRVVPTLNDVNLLMYDFAGQQEYYCTHHIFLTERALYILAVDISKYSTSTHDDQVQFLDSSLAHPNFDMIDIICWPFARL